MKWSVCYCCGTIGFKMIPRTREVENMTLPVPDQLLHWLCGTLSRRMWRRESILPWFACFHLHQVVRINLQGSIYSATQRRREKRVKATDNKSAFVAGRGDAVDACTNGVAPSWRCRHTACRPRRCWSTTASSPCSPCSISESDSAGHHTPAGCRNAWDAHAGIKVIGNTVLFFSQVSKDRGHTCCQHPLPLSFHYIQCCDYE